MEIKYIEKTLREVLSVFEECSTQYRVLGSMLVVAYTGKVHRPIGDIDVFTEKSKLNCLLVAFEKRGFRIKVNKELGVNAVVSIFREDSLKINLAVLGEFTPEGFVQPVAFTKTTYSNSFVEATSYVLGETEFIGIPLEVQYYTMRKSKDKPGRALDFAVLEHAVPHEFRNINYPAKFELFGVPIPGAFSFFSTFKNFWGSVRLLVGKSYEFFD
jgi:hypothetical protein